ncbi:transposase [Oribacterium sp. oral taxon 078]|uniref:transposase n=1 Tax=Oribacterium sp. oral taxon 078 TaxID=652706 RepID=UPI0012DD6FBC
MCQQSIEEKKNAVKHCFERGESVKSVSKELGCSTTSLYPWRDKYLRRGTVSLMKKKKQDTRHHSGLSLRRSKKTPAPHIINREDLEWLRQKA